MMRLLLIMASGAALAACDAEKAEPQAAAPAVEGAWVIDKAASRIEFSGTQTGKRFSGAFEEYDATIVFDPADLSSARIEAVIDTGSAKTGDRQRDAALPGAEWFSVEAFPEARFTAGSITQTGVDDYKARATLSIRGVEKPLTLPFSVTITGDRAVADTAVALNRADFGVGQGEFLTDQWVGYEVLVTVHLEATR